LIGAVATIIVEVYLVLWYFDQPLSHSQPTSQHPHIPSQATSDLQLNEETDNLHFEDPRHLEPKDAQKQEENYMNSKILPKQQEGIELTD